ncbi:MAG: UPF0179 family protein [Methanomassiliicoccus sp.]|jgi:uncharacterized protein (UPF0179 family)|nr:UPF0179 family protein [Methanomassiliicoccus sp.]
MVVITLIGEHLAKEGDEFVYRGPLTECRDCKLKGVCFNLDTGGLYRINAVRSVKHLCRIHEEGVRVVEVQKLQQKCALPQKYALEGSTITFEEVKCKSPGCENYRICHPMGLEKNMKFRVRSIDGDIKCPEGHRLVAVTLE